MWGDANFSTLVLKILEIVDVLILVVFALALLIMLWKIASAWIISSDESQKRAEAKNTVLIGFIVLVVMSAVWGIVALLQASLGTASLDSSSSRSVPTNTSGSNTTIRDNRDPFPSIDVQRESNNTPDPSIPYGFPTGGTNTNTNTSYSTPDGR